MTHITLGKFTDDFYLWMDINRYAFTTIGNVKVYLSAFLTFIHGKTWRNIPAQRITTEDIYRYKTYYLHEKGYAQVSWDRLCSLLKLAFVTYGTDYKHLKFPISKDILKTTTAKSRRTDWLRPEDYETVIAEIQKESSPAIASFYLMIFEVLLSTGVRAGEISEVKMKDVNFKNDGSATMNVMTLKQRFRAHIEREVRIGKRACRALKTYLKYREQIIGPVSNEDFMLKPLGQPHKFSKKKLASDRVTVYFKKIGERCGMRLTCHVLRHTHTTWAVKAGASMASVSRHLGHSSIAVTETYLHHQQQDALNEHEEIEIFDADTVNIKSKYAREKENREMHTENVAERVTQAINTGLFHLASLFMPITHEPIYQEPFLGCENLANGWTLKRFRHFSKSSIDNSKPGVANMPRRVFR